MPFVILGALIVGLLLGLMGAGGSILTVPVLVYMLGHDGKVAVAESLAIVGSIALVTLIPYARSREVDWRSVWYFGLPGIAGSYAGAWLSHLVPAAVQLTLFAIVMLVAAGLMLRRSNRRQTNGRTNDARGAASQPRLALAGEGLLVGALTGLVGVGGGFLIVPALVIYGKMPMRAAIGTSLAIIAINSFSGFLKYLDVLQALGVSVHWETVAIFVSVGIAGSLVGHSLATRLDQGLLRKGFAIFLVGMGLFVLGREAPKLLASPRRERVIRSSVGSHRIAGGPEASRRNGGVLSPQHAAGDLPSHRIQ